MQTGRHCSLWTTGQVSCMQEYLILVAVLRTAAPQICKRKSGSDQGDDEGGGTE